MSNYITHRENVAATKKKPFKGNNHSKQPAPRTVVPRVRREDNPIRDGLAGVSAAIAVAIIAQLGTKVTNWIQKNGGNAPNRKHDGPVRETEEADPPESIINTPTRNRGGRLTGGVGEALLMAHQQHPAVEDKALFYTFNVSWGCQSENAHIGKRDSSALPMAAGVCHAKKNFCVSNLLQFIAEVDTPKLGCIGLQEVTDFLLAKMREEENINLKIMVSKHGSRIRLATLVNRSLFPHASILMQGEYKPGRPWHLLKLRRGLGLLNVHCPHWKRSPSPPVTPEQLWRIRNDFTHLIVVGDFNMPRLGPGHEFDFFGFRMQLSESGKPPLTCCDPSGYSHSYRRTGDLVLSNLPHSELFVPRTRKAISDHAPCAAEVMLPLS